jgi:hypothetical protein
VSAILLMKTPQGSLVPLDTDEAGKLKRFKVGASISAEVKAIRNGQFHRKMFALLRFCYEHFEEMRRGTRQWRDMPVMTSFDRFREELIIMAGYYTPVFNIKGEVKVNAKSLSYANCEPEEFERIYSDVIDAALKYVFNGIDMNNARLRGIVDQLLQFDN